MSIRTSLVLVLSVAACGGGQKPLRVDDARLARLPSESRQALLDVERPVRAAEIDLEGAQVAERDAKSFQSIVHNERDAAKRQVEEAQRALKAAQQRQRAADAKAEYTKELVAFRGEIVQRRKTELDALRAEAEVQKVQQLVSAGQAEGLDARPFDKAAIDARRRATEAAARVDARRGKVEERRAAWQSVRVTGEDVADAQPPPTALEDVR
jgi:hypothetical protein